MTDELFSDLRMGNKAMKESDEQKALVKILKAAGIRYLAPLNGAALSGGARQWNHLAAMGASKGAPDLIVLPSGMLPIFVEMKRAKNHRGFTSGDVPCPCMSAEQVDWASFITDEHLYILAHGCADALEQLRKYGVRI